MNKIKYVTFLLAAITSVNAVSQLEPIIYAGLTNAGGDVGIKLNVLHPYQTGTHHYKLGMATEFGLLLNDDSDVYLNCSGLIAFSDNNTLGIGTQYIYCTGKYHTNYLLEKTTISYQQPVAFFNNAELGIKIAFPGKAYEVIEKEGETHIIEEQYEWNDEKNDWERLTPVVDDELVISLTAQFYVFEKE